VGLVKQRAEAEDPLIALPVNAILPHRLARLCAVAGARLIHFSTDCVFSGETGNYRESDIPDARDLYGRSKLLGEVSDEHALTLRVSIIGPELQGTQGLLGWFLAQPGPVRGFRRAVFSGLTTLELARVVRDRLLPRPDLHGLYHLSADPIAKFDLLTLAGKIYAHPIRIDACDEPVIDRSLDSTRLRMALDYRPPSWQEMLLQLRENTLHA
jgi:dTDP-4-dehydrorhamnose reductase